MIKWIDFFILIDFLIVAIITTKIGLQFLQITTELPELQDFHEFLGVEGPGDHGAKTVMLTLFSQLYILQ